MEFFSAEGLEIIQIVVTVALGGALCFLGIVVNIINMFMFWKLGLGQTVNISMFAIAVSDLFSLVMLQWVNINLNPFMENADIPYEPSDITYLTGRWPHACFLQITIWITVLVTAERFVCIALPLKVKQIFTPLRTKIFISVIDFLIIISALPTYIYFYLGDTFKSARNQTRVGLKSRDITLFLPELAFVMHIVLEITSFVALTVFTCLLVVALKRSLKWRKTISANIDQCQVLSRSGTRTMKMVGLVAGVLIVCAAPGVLISISEIVFYHFLRVELYSKSFQGLWSFAFFARAFSATFNTVLFHKMSSKYKQHFNDIFSTCTARCHGCKRTD